MPRRWFLFAALAAALPFALTGCGGNGGGAVQDKVGGAATAVGNTVQDAASNVAGVAPVTFKLQEQGSSGVSGNAVVTPEGSNRSRISLVLNAGNNGSKKFSAGLFQGGCSGISGSPKYDLGQVGGGQDTMTVNAAIQDLKDGNYVFALRDGSTLVACGGIG